MEAEHISFEQSKVGDEQFGLSPRRIKFYVR